MRKFIYVGTLCFLKQGGWSGTYIEQGQQIGLCT